MMRFVKKQVNQNTTTVNGVVIIVPSFMSHIGMQLTMHNGYLLKLAGNVAYQQKQNGNMLAEQIQTPNTIQARL